MTEEVREVKNIHEAIAAIYEQVGYVQKERNSNLNYSYAGEAALIRALRPALVAYGVYMSVVEISDVTHEFYTNTNGKQMINVTLRAVIRFTHAPSETYIDVVSVGEGSDSGDKAQNKALTGAFKYALRQTFMIETGDDPDASASDEHQSAGVKKEVAKTKATVKSKKALVDYAASKGMDAAALGKALGAAGFSEVDLARWDDMIAAVDVYAGK